MDNFDHWFKFLATLVVTMIVLLFVAGVVIGIHFLAKVW
jgi:uncharacterized protein YneF (UPF0154 family)